MCLCVCVYQCVCALLSCSFIKRLIGHQTHLSVLTHTQPSLLLCCLMCPNHNWQALIMQPQAQGNPPLSPSPLLPHTLFNYEIMSKTLYSPLCYFPLPLPHSLSPALLFNLISSSSETLRTFNCLQFLACSTASVCVCKCVRVCVSFWASYR